MSAVGAGSGRIPAELSYESMRFSPKMLSFLKLLYPVTEEGVWGFSKIGILEATKIDQCLARLFQANEQGRQRFASFSRLPFEAFRKGAANQAFFPICQPGRDIGKISSDLKTLALSSASGHPQEAAVAYLLSLIVGKASAEKPFAFELAAALTTFQATVPTLPGLALPAMPSALKKRPSVRSSLANLGELGAALQDVQIGRPAAAQSPSVDRPSAPTNFFASTGVTPTSSANSSPEKPWTPGTGAPRGHIVAPVAARALSFPMPSLPGAGALKRQPTVGRVLAFTAAATTCKPRRKMNTQGAVDSADAKPGFEMKRRFDDQPASGKLLPAQSPAAVPPALLLSAAAYPLQVSPGGRSPEAAEGVGVGRQLKLRRPNREGEGPVLSSQKNAVPTVSLRAGVPLSSPLLFAKAADAEAVMAELMEELGIPPLPNLA